MTRAAGITARVQSARTRGLAVLALFVGLGATAASPALTLGELQVRSSLGEPLSAVVQVDAAAGEVLRRECFAPGPDVAAVPGIPRTDDLRMVLERQGNNGLLRLISQSAVKEPVTQVVLQVRCPGLPSLTRSFVVLLDPAAIAQPASALPAPAPRATRRSPRTVSGGDIAPGGSYVVRSGDTLSGIASRIAGRPSYSVWPLAARIRALNPGAFENGRADKLIAGSRLQIPGLDSLAVEAPALAAASARRPVTGPAVRPAAREAVDHATGSESAVESRRPGRPLIETPVLLGEPVPGTELNYLVISLELSPLSRARIAERARAPEVPPATEPEPVAVEPPPVASPEQEDGGFGQAWYWLLALLVVIGGGLLTLLFLRRRPAPRAETTEGSPWELGDDENAEAVVEELEAASGAMLVEEPVAKVYDDFTGTFVDVVPTEEITAAPVSRGADPEDDIQTHLMPTIDEPAQATENPDELSLAPTDQPKLEGLAERVPALGKRQDDQDINVTMVNEAEEQLGDDGWVELDFEATQILEQDYLAEYARSLKDKVKEQSASEDADDALAADSDDPLLAASELIDALDEDLLTAEMMELEEPADSGSTSELPTVSETFGEEDEDPTASVTTLELETDDNVVAIDKAKKNVDDEDPEQQPRKGGKKS